MSSTTDYTIELEAAADSFLVGNRHVLLGFFRFLYEKANFTSDPTKEAERVVHLWMDGTGLEWVLHNLHKIDLPKALS